MIAAVVLVTLGMSTIVYVTVVMLLDMWQQIMS